MSTNPLLAKDRTQIEEGIIAAVKQVLPTTTVEITRDTRLFDDLGLDSTSVLELLLGMEEEIGVELDPDSFEQHHFESVASLAELVDQQAG